MNAGFVTASGKGVQVSEEALQKARQLFEELEGDFEENIGGKNASKASCSNVRNSVSTPVTPVFSTASRHNPKRISSTFNSPVMKNPRLENGMCKKESISPIKGISVSSAPTTPKNNVCSEIGNVTPIKLLTPYCKNWRLCIKVTSVDEIRHFRGKQAFSFHGVDDSGVEIRVSAFDGTACKIATIVHPEQMYYITRASVKQMNRRYSRNQHDMEVVLRSDSEITECTDRPHISSPKVNFDFVQIQDLQNFIDTEIDVLGIVIDIGELRQLKSRSGEELQKREVQIVDDSGYYVIVTIWGHKAKKLSDEQFEHVLAIKGLFARCFQGTVSLVTMMSSKLLFDPDVPEADVLRLWYNENKGKAYKPASTNKVLSFQEHKWLGQLMPSSNAHVFNVTAMISSITTQNAVYKGCQTCKKKLLVEKDGDMYICQKCGICSEYKYYYLFHMELFDFTGTIRVTTFDDCAQKLLGEEADEVAKFLKFDNDRYQSRFKSVLFKPFMFRLSARKKESIDYTSASSVKKRSYFWSTVDLAPMPFDSYCTFLHRMTEHALSNAEMPTKI